MGKRNGNLPSAISHFPRPLTIHEGPGSMWCGLELAAEQEHNKGARTGRWRRHVGESPNFSNMWLENLQTRRLAARFYVSDISNDRTLGRNPLSLIFAMLRDQLCRCGRISLTYSKSPLLKLS